MPETIICRIKMDRPPTLEDRAKRVGFQEFVEELQKQGWIYEKDIALRKFHITYEGHCQQDNHYIQWTAVAQE